MSLLESVTKMVKPCRDSVVENPVDPQSKTLLQCQSWSKRTLQLSTQEQQRKSQNVDMVLTGGDREPLQVHRLVMARASSQLAALLQAHGHLDEVSLLIPEADKETLGAVVQLIYFGFCSLDSEGGLSRVTTVASILGLENVAAEIEPTLQISHEELKGDVLQVKLPPVMEKPVEKIVMKKNIGRKTVLKSNLVKSGLILLNQPETFENLPSAALSKFGCSSCIKTFTRKNDLLRHMMLHTGERRFSCTFCATKFISSGDLHKHVRIHTGEKPYACQFSKCTKAFTQKGDLNKHMKIHLDQKNYQCEQCNYRCIQGNDLRNHMLVHSECKPFCCDLCSKEFRRKNQLKAHKKKLHKPAVT